MENESSIKEIIRNSLEQVRAVIDADTIVGKQIVTPSGVVIIPISKVSMGFASGGLDLPNAGCADGKKNFGGGGGTGVTVSPVGFLTVSPDGAVELIPMTPDKTTPIEQIAEIINNAPAVIGRIKNVFTKGETEDTAPVTADAQKATDDLEEAYRQKLAEEATDDTERVASEAEKILEGEEIPLSKEEIKRLKKEAKERKKQEKKQQSAPVEMHSPEDDPVQKRGKLSEKTLEKGIVK